jgi:methionine-rich copper-binding protein CopC
MTSHRARLVAVTIVGLAIVGATAVPASAHAAYKGSDPADESKVESVPSQIWAEFTQAPENGSRMEVYGPCGNRIDAGDSRVEGSRVYVSAAGNNSGIHTVVWVVTSIDSHDTRGEFTFTVTSGDPCPGEEPAEPKEPRQRERDREQPPNTSNDTGDTGDPGGGEPAADTDQADTDSDTGGAGGDDRDRGGRDKNGTGSNQREGNGSQRNRSDDEPQVVAADVTEPEEPGLFTGIPIGGLLAALLMAAIIGAGGGLIYAGIMGYRS